MRVQNINISLRAAGATDGRAAEKKTGRKTIFAADLMRKPEQNLKRSGVEKRREEARKQATKLISDTLKADKKLDDSVNESRARMEELSAENVELIKEKKALREKLDAAEPGGADREELEQQMAEYDSRIQENEAEIKGNSKSIQSGKLERLKSDPMLEASKAAEKIELSAAKEYAFSLQSEAKENIDKKMQENKEKGEKLQEKLEKEKEALEKSVEKSKERREEAEEQMAENAEKAAELQAELEKGQEDVSRELNEIRRRMKLLEEDLKGVSMDVVQ